MTDYYRRAFNPSKSYLVSGFPWGYGEFPIMWDGDVSANIPAYKEQFEVCPPGYRRPTDGYTDKISYNGIMIICRMRVLRVLPRIIKIK